MIDIDDAALLDQGSKEWLEAKLGVFGGTTFHKVQSTGETYKTIIYEKAAQRLLSTYQSSFTSKHTQWGNDNENRARIRYCMETGNKVQLAGLLYSSFSEWCAVSPDGLVGLDGGTEIKCPSTTREHIRHIINGPPPVYIAQIQGCMMATGRLWWDFVSYDPRLDEYPGTMKAAIHIRRYYRDEDYIAHLKHCVLKAIDDVQNILEIITE